MIADNDRHQFAVGVKGDFRQHRLLLLQLGPVEAPFHGQRQQRSLRRVADYFPSAAPRLQVAIIAQEADFRRAQHPISLGETGWPKTDLSLRPVSTLR